jgi:uncharacterized protein (TIGR02145 family)
MAIVGFGIFSSCNVEKEELSSSQFVDNRDGNIYSFVEIGNQIWMAENLKWSPDFVYKNDQKNLNEYGGLYKWSSANSACPAGWHLPGLEEWKELESYLLSQYSKPDSLGYYLKSKTKWLESGNGSNEIGFNILPAGKWDHNGDFFGLGSYAYFWTSTYGKIIDDPRVVWDPFARTIYFSAKSSGILKDGDDPSNGLSIRCVKDTI